MWVVYDEKDYVLGVYKHKAAALRCARACANAGYIGVTVRYDERVDCGE